MKIYWKYPTKTCLDTTLKLYPTIAKKSILAEDGEIPSYFI